MKNLLLAGVLVFTMAAEPATAVAGPIADTCSGAYEALRVLNARIEELKNRPGDLYDLKIVQFEIMLLETLKKDPQDIIRRTCSV